MKSIKVSVEMLKKMAKTCDLEKLFNDKADAFSYDAEIYVAVGSSSSAMDGCRTVSAHKALLLTKYVGVLKPMNCYDHHEAIENKTRKRGYNGRLVRIGGFDYVLTEPICFINENITL